MSVNQQLFDLVKRINENPEHIKDEKNRVFQVNLESNVTMQILLQEGTISVIEEATHIPDVIITITDKYFSKFLNGDLNTTLAFMSGGLKIEGKMGLALKLQEIIKLYQ